MKYVCLGFFDEAAFAQIPQADAQRIMEECFAGARPSLAGTAIE